MISQQLMLGDWVMLNPDLKKYYPFAGKPCMVIGLHDDDGAIKIEYDNGKYFWTDAEDDVISIPLTPEILEKNGFVHYEEDEESFHSEDCVFIKQNLGGYGACLDKIRTISGIFYYVHELQHVLKLCGIEKEIEL